jgi:tRNA/tmRNA/rRNA uracil-C5-methylase (TrmA/RlmC/RlmD family)
MPPLSPGALVELTIERPVAGGRMLARHEGQVVLVDGAIPGETVRATIERLGRVALAKVVEVLEPSPHRREPASDPSCGGMAYGHIAAAAQPALKQAVVIDALRHGARVDWTAALPVHASPERGYRIRARLHVRRGRIGFFREGTHEICHAAGTGQLSEESIAVLDRFVAGLAPGASAVLDAIEIAENLAGDERVAHLVWAERGRALPKAAGAVSLCEGLSGVTADDPAGGLPVALAGTSFVADDVALLAGGEAPKDARLRRHASAFFQANRFLLRPLVDAVVAQVPPGPVVDLYAGVGLFAVALASRGFAELTAVEGEGVSGADLIANAAPFAGTVRVARTSVEAWAARASLAPDTTIIVDPPRTGMSREALERVLALRAPRLVYVSCDVATFARDVRRASEAGYRLAHVEAFDLFPNTAHVETLGVLIR